MTKYTTANWSVWKVARAACCFIFGWNGGGVELIRGASSLVLEGSSPFVSLLACPGYASWCWRRRWLSYTFAILRRNSRDMTSRMTLRQEAAKILLEVICHDSEMKPVCQWVYMWAARVYTDRNLLCSNSIASTGVCQFIVLSTIIRSGLEQSAYGNFAWRSCFIWYRSSRCSRRGGSCHRIHVAHIHDFRRSSVLLVVS
jgi:hypothetical protein